MKRYYLRDRGASPQMTLLAVILAVVFLMLTAARGDETCSTRSAWVGDEAVVTTPTFSTTIGN